MTDLACIQDGPVARAPAQVAIKALLQDILCGLLPLLLAFGQGLVSGHNEAGGTETTL